LYFNGLASYALIAEDLNVGALIFSGYESNASAIKLALGCTLPLHSLPLFSLLYNVAFAPAQNGKYARAAGTSTFCTSQLNKYCKLKLNSG